MERKSKRMMTVLLLSLAMLATTFQECLSDSSQPPSKRMSTKSTPPRNAGSTIVFPVTGNVYPHGGYSVSLQIGNPPKNFELDFDTGSDLTWVQCEAPCQNCTQPRGSLYKPNNNFISSDDPLCKAIQASGKPLNKSPNDLCNYKIEYADHSSSRGVLVSDQFSLRPTKGSQLIPRLGFGCGYDQKYSGPYPHQSTAGVLGLGNGKAGIMSQLNALHLTRNVLGHCLSGQGGGFLFLGDDFVSPSGIVWTPMSHGSSGKQYSSGQAELLYDRKATGVKGLQVIFDSGSTYTYFDPQAYKTTLDMLSRDLKGKPLIETRDPALSICWKGPKPFKTVSDVKHYFKPLHLSFTAAENALLELSPRAYLIVSELGNVCLGILNGAEVGLQDLNLIGDISMQDKLVIYNNEKQQIGWISSNCNNPSPELLDGSRKLSLHESVWGRKVKHISLAKRNQCKEHSPIPTSH
ncbi:aspartic proteinase Asp1-like isoform X2 [Mangifera indica]|uniref:aspartic proteinase Asp1-like isoform X2 n=1 Tax=Mangifera indica TaxID=29780 RepID=UPI001CF95881|nr:aspartic proteinase Asp1-like isoform X2 [Mangifera indica]